MILEDFSWPVADTEETVFSYQMFYIPVDILPMVDDHMCMAVGIALQHDDIREIVLLCQIQDRMGQKASVQNDPLDLHAAAF